MKRESTDGKGRDVYKLRTLEITKGTEINSRLRYIVEIVEIIREDICVTAKETGQRERMEVEISLDRLPGYPLHRVYVLSDTDMVGRKSCDSFSPVSVSPFKRRVDGPFLLVAAH